MSAHRGTAVLVLGVLSLVMCQFLGPVAWIMGKNDLEEIRGGRMDPSGEGSTQAGMICGIIATVIMGLAVIGFLLVFVVFGAAAVALAS